MIYTDEDTDDGISDNDSEVDNIEEEVVAGFNCINLIKKRLEKTYSVNRGGLHSGNNYELI